MKRKTKATVTTVTIIASLIAVSVWGVHMKNQKEQARVIRIAFENFRVAFDSEVPQKAYDLMSPRYKEKHTVQEFAKDFSEIAPLDSDWCVLREGGDKARLCCTHPGASFSPKSTMTYVFERIGGTWYFSGESEMWLD